MDQVVRGATVPRARDNFSLSKTLFVVGMHLGALGAFWHTTWAAIGVCILLHWLFGGLGICVGYHRLLTHRSFQCPRWLEYTFATFGALSLQGAPIEWVTHHRQHHQFPDQDGDPHNAGKGFWWGHMFWIFWTHNDDAYWDGLTERYVPDLQRQRFYHILGKAYIPLTVALGLILYALGGWPFLIWGLFVRTVLTYHCTFLVNSASHTFGYKTFATKDRSTNCWWVALLSYGEGWHNNHHSFPTSARHGFKAWELDPSYWFIQSLRVMRLAWDLRLPSLEE